LEGLKKVFQTSSGEIVLNPGSGTGAWESCLVNTLSPGDRVLGCVNGHFSARFCDTAAAHGIEVERIEVPYGAAVAAEQVEERLRADRDRRLKAVLVLHNETSTGVVTDIGAIRGALDRAAHPALLLVDVVSSLASIDFRSMCGGWTSRSRVRKRG
jgi:alanine-glyoxylate transaminase/serine-glyoxylate transaminase/serine-pyruvate transaminase